MFKKVLGKKLSRATGSRKALFRALLKSLVESGKIITTKAKAKAVQREVDRVFALLKKEDMAARRRLLAILGNDKKILESLIAKYAVTTKDRTSGFTRIISLPQRRGDMAKMATLELVDKATEIKHEKKVKTKKEKKVAAKTKPTKKTTKKVSRPRGQ